MPSMAGEADSWLMPLPLHIIAQKIQNWRIDSGMVPLGFLFFFFPVVQWTAALMLVFGDAVRVAMSGGQTASSHSTYVGNSLHQKMERVCEQCAISAAAGLPLTKLPGLLPKPPPS